jgi:hypothetical protein
MTRVTVSLPVPDISTFAKALKRDWPSEPPGHLSLLNHLARAAGFGNIQHLRASQLAEARGEAPKPVVDHALVERLLRHFDKAGRLLRWPSRTSVQWQVVWVLWSHLPSGEAMTERGVSQRLNDWHLFGDAAILRRTMVEIGLLTRNPDATDYRRVERAPPPEIQTLIRRLRRGAAGG